MYSQELQNQKRLADVYKKHFEDATEHIEELENAAAASKEAHVRALTQMKDKMGFDLEQVEEAHVAQQTESALKIAELEQKLNELEADPRLTQGSTLVLTDGSENQGKEQEVNIIPNEFSSLTATAMYDRVIQSEKAASAEACKRKDTEVVFLLTYNSKRKTRCKF